MRVRPWARFLPAIAVTALLSIAAAAPRAPGTGRGHAPATAAPPSQIYPPCDSFVTSGTGDSTYAFNIDQGITQPLPSGISVASCSLRVDGLPAHNAYNVNWAHLAVRQWDPLTLAPDAGTIALRTFLFDPSSLQYTFPRAPGVEFVPPLVTRSLAHVAEPTRLTTALEIVTSEESYGGGFLAYFDPSSGSVLPAARSIDVAGVRGPLPGAHPVFAHALCDGDADLQQLRVAQSVMRTNGFPTLAVAEIAQRFRVPERVELRWVELAIGAIGAPPIADLASKGLAAPAPRMSAATPVVGIIDGHQLSAPTAAMPPSLIEAVLNFSSWRREYPVWVGNNDFDTTVVLEPLHDYWVYVRQASFMNCYLATLDGSESADFTSGIGPCYERDGATDPWAPSVGHALSFRIVGRPLAGTGPPPPSPVRLLLRVAPNPARGPVTATWSGGVGPVRLEVFDARGRRVATDDGGAAGVWQWSRLDGRGRPLPSGVYFVHARDSQGMQAVQRLVITR